MPAAEPDDGSAEDEGLLEAIGRRAIDTLPLTVAILDSRGVIVETNASWRTFGRDNGLRPPLDSIGANYLDVCEAAADEHATRAGEGIRAVLAGEAESFSVEYPCHAPAERRWYLLRAIPFEFEGDRYATVAHSDITDRKLAELAAERHAEELAEEREQYALLNQIVRHDIRNDMNVVRGWVSLLADHVDEEGADALAHVADATDHVLDLTRTLGDLSETIAGDGPEPEPVPLGPVLRSEIEKARTAFDRRAEPVEIDGPDGDVDATVLADDLLSSVVSNLVSNAVLHNDKATPRVEVSVSVGDDTATVRVADNGPGIPEELRETVFGREEKSLESPGMGLGLYLVDTLVSRYGGEVRLRDNEPEGAVFEVELRLA